MGHEWIEVRDRRWCVRCDCFQSKPNAGAKFWETKDPCANKYHQNRQRPLSDILELALSDTSQVRATQGE